MQYRKDIDGLRALAVVPVILFHAKFDLFKGGFVGVDVFFVISGFLITNIILQSSDGITSFLVGFYERRIRRLAPPIVLTLLASLGAGFYLMPPAEYHELSLSAVSALTFVSNLFFLFQADYFDGPAQLKPLLHSWSLSIEEQFYILFPALIIFLNNISRKHAIIFISIICFTSFVCGVYLSLFGDPANAFFNSLGRFWEIGFGALLAAINVRIPKGGKSNVASIFGLALIVIPIFLYSEELDWPGYYALLPVIGTGLILISNNGFANKVLSFKLFVWIGLVSYALYLFHWPIFVFMQFLFPRPEMWNYIIAIVLTFILAIGSYFLLEQPIRRKRVINSYSKLLFIFIGTSASLIMMALTIAYFKGFPSRFPEASREYLTQLEVVRREWDNSSRRGECWVDHRVDFAPVIERCVKLSPDQKNVLVIGDSHAAHLLAGLESNFPTTSFSLLAVDSCNLVRNGQENRPACAALVSYLSAGIPQGFDAIIISGRNIGAQDYEEVVSRTMSISNGAKIYFIGPIPFYEPHMPVVYPDMVGRYSQGLIIARFDQYLDPSRAELNETLRDMAENMGQVSYMDSLEVMCPVGPCNHFDGDGLPVLLDASHLTPTASKELISGLHEGQGLLQDFNYLPVRLRPSFEFMGVEEWYVQAGTQILPVEIPSDPVLENRTDVLSIESLNEFLSIENQGMHLSMPNDGRFTRTMHLEEVQLVPATLRVEFDVQTTLSEPQLFDIVLQRGCGPIVEEGTGFPLNLQTGSSSHVYEYTFLEQAFECVQIRIWNRGPLIELELSNIHVELIPK